jgi:hypothetical protein
VKSLGQTPQPSPSAPQTQHRTEVLITNRRAGDLRKKCLERDGHRCVISVKFHMQEAEARQDRHGEAIDDDGQPVYPPGGGPGVGGLEACHIIPLALSEGNQDEVYLWHFSSTYIIC